jgi:uncharacterized protein (DUF1697 family)
MTRYVALLRAVNVGGTGKLPMTELKSMCSAAGFARVETYIASGNVIFEGRAGPAKMKAALEACLLDYFGKPMGVMVRTAAEMAAVLKANPFPEADPKLTYAIFLDKPPPRDTLDHVVGKNREKICLGEREIFVHYQDGMGRSKLRIPAAALGTARNMNTVAKLAEIAAKN